MNPNPAWRGVVLEDDTIWAWPTLLMDHREAFAQLPHLANYRTRWRQWHPGEPVDFDAGSDMEDIVRVCEWVKTAVN